MADPLLVPAPSGATRVAGVIGTPVRHSRSPAVVNAAFAAACLDWTYAAFEVAPGRAADAVSAMRTLGLGGLSVTTPHKRDVIASLDELTPAAADLDAVNCIAWAGDRLVGHNTDGDGLVASLRASDGIDPTGARCVVLGAGGAARSVVRALAEAGAADVVVVNRTPEKGEEAAALAGAVGRSGTEADLASADLVINATSVGMGVAPGAEEPLPVDPQRLGAHQVVIDLVYLPLQTPLLLLAEQRGARTVDGLGMLVHQAAIAITLWTGVAPDIATMDAAARA
ncbi:MAG: aroE [Acidimicrobiales bacterium]|nr:aroE [Acidimicrobiales bacterium]